MAEQNTAKEGQVSEMNPRQTAEIPIAPGPIAPVAGGPGAGATLEGDLQAHIGRGPRRLRHSTALLQDADPESVSRQFERGGEANNAPSPDDDIYSLHSSIVG